MFSPCAKACEEDLIGSLNRQWRKDHAGSYPTSLCISCLDQTLQQAFGRGVEPASALHLRWRGDSSPRQQCFQDVARATEFAINNLGISEILVCGHSRCLCGQSSPCESKQPFPGGFERLITRVAEGAQRAKRARTQLVDRLSLIEGIPAVIRARWRNKLRVVGLLFLPDSAIWQVYDEQAHGFRTLFEPSNIA
jgi:carbonic anhydrase